jgi:hypothetical protein
MATITLYVKHYKDDNNVEHIDIDQSLSGLAGTTENRTLDWTFRENSDYLFGPVLGRSRRVSIDRIDNEFLRKGWLPDTEEHGAINAYAKSDTPKSNNTWIAEQVRGPFRHVIASPVYKSLYSVQTWGFEEINGERRYVRHVDFVGSNDEHIQARMVYDYCERVLRTGTLS